MDAQFMLKPEAIEKATKALGSKPGVKAKHMSIEPSDNKGFITHVTPHVDGQPAGRTEHHVHANVDELLKHVGQNYRSNALEETEERGAEAAGGKTKESKAEESAEGER